MTKQNYVDIFLIVSSWHMISCHLISDIIHDTFYNFDILFYHCYERIKNNLPALTLVWSFPIPTSKVILIRIRKEAIVLV